MNDRIEEIRERLTSATPGPWRIDENDPTIFDSIVSTANDEPWGWVEVARSLGPDSDLIASAPADIAFLLAEVERLRAKNAELNRRAQNAESNRTAKYDRWRSLGTDLLVARGRQGELEKHLDWWEKQGHSTVGIDWLRRHFGIKR